MLNKNIYISMIATLPYFSFGVYAPSMPHMFTYFNVQFSYIAFGALCYLLSLAISQLIIYYISERFCRSSVVITLLTIFFIGSFGITFSDTIGEFILFQIIMGFGSATSNLASLTINNMNKRDEKINMKRLGLYIAILIITPNSIGGFFISTFSWKFIFLLLSLYSFVLIILTIKYRKIFICEKNSPSEFNKKTITLIRDMIKNKSFIFNSSILAVSSCVFITYDLISPFIYQNFYGFSPMEFSICAVISSASYLIGNSISASTAYKDKRSHLSFFGITLIILSGFLLCSIYYRRTHINSPELILISSILLFIGYGILQKSTFLVQEFFHKNLEASFSLTGMLNMSMSFFVICIFIFREDNPIKIYILSSSICALIVLMICAGMVFAMRKRNMPCE